MCVCVLQSQKIGLVNGGPITGCFIHRLTKYTGYKDFPSSPFQSHIFIKKRVIIQIRSVLELSTSFTDCTHYIAVIMILIYTLRACVGACMRGCVLACMHVFVCIGYMVADLAGHRFGTNLQNLGHYHSFRLTTGNYVV